jgi:hypothetical protein
VNHKNRKLIGQVYETSAVDDCHLSHRRIILRKDKKRKEKLGNDILLRFRGPTNTYYMMTKTTIFAVTYQQEKLPIQGWLPFGILQMSFLSMYMTVG